VPAGSPAPACGWRLARDPADAAAGRGPAAADHSAGGSRRGRARGSRGEYPRRRSGSRERPRPGHAAVQRTRPGHIAATGRRERSSYAPRRRPSNHAGSSGGAATVAVARQLCRELAPSLSGWAPGRRRGLLHDRDGAAPCRPGRDGSSGRDASGPPHGAPGHPGSDLRRRAPGRGARSLSHAVRGVTRP
jgi:hypothetical protein